MIEKFRGYIESNHLINKGDHILVALSGGIDSMVLAELLRRCGYDIAFAHCNFHLRGAESDDDEVFVRKYAERVRVTLFVRQFDTLDFAANNKISVEMAARELRYSWFNDLIAANQSLDNGDASENSSVVSNGCSLGKNLRFDKLALAHHADDQIETFFINLLRGSGIKGLKAMKPCNGLYIRPLLWASREEIRQFAIKNDITWREDRTNQDTAFLRNKIRHELIPFLDEFKPEARRKILESVSHMASENRLYEELVNEKLSQIEKTDGVLHSINKRHFERNASMSGSLMQSRQLLFEWIRQFGFSFSQCESIFTALAAEPGKTFYSNDYELVIEKNTIDVFPIDFNPRHEEMLSFSIFEKTSQFSLLTSNPNIARLDYSTLKLPLKARFWQHGDRFRPLGMRGSKLVSDFFNDNGFTTFQKKNTIILTDSDDKIVWIVGYRIDDRFKITEKTKTICQIIFSN